MTRTWNEVKRRLEQIRTDVTGVNWHAAVERGDTLTTAQSCRAVQDQNHPSRVTFCARCGHATASYQAHYWKWCRKRPDTLGALARGTDTGVDFHVCCPDSCSLDDPAPDPVQPCHPAPGTYKEWAAQRVADAENMAVWREMVEESEALRKKENRDH